MKYIQYFTLRAANAFKFVPTNLVGKYGRFNPVVNGYTLDKDFLVLDHAVIHPSSLV